MEVDAPAPGIRQTHQKVDQEEDVLVRERRDERTVPEVNSPGQRRTRRTGLEADTRAPDQEVEAPVHEQGGRHSRYVNEQAGLEVDAP